MAFVDGGMDFSSNEAKKQLRRRQRIGTVFAAVLLMCTLFGLVFLTALIIDVAIEGAPWLSPAISCALDDESSALCDATLRDDRQTSYERSVDGILDGIASSHFTLGFMSYAEYQANYSRVKPVAIESTGGACNAPSPDAAPGSDYPLGDVVFVVNRQNDWLECLSTAQIAGLLQINSGFINWSSIDASFPAEQIEFYLPQDDTEAYATIQQVVTAKTRRPLINTRLFNNYHSRDPVNAGMKSAIVGSLIVIGLTGLLSFPIGVGTAVYLEEYAPQNKLTNFINVNINNLSGVPSIVYGMLGLVVFGRMFGVFSPNSWLVNTFNLQVETGGSGGWVFNLLGIPWLEMHLPFQRSMVAGAATMTLLILPVVIIASREAVRAVPSSIREAAFGLGATRWQVVSRQVLPSAIPGILTGVILALSRAIGETAPLIIMGAFTYVPFLPESIWDQFTVMPIQIYNWITLPQHDYRFGLAGAGIIILLAILLAMNGLAVYLRNQFEVKW